MDQSALLDHQFTVAAYAVTWAIQLAMWPWLGFKWWRALKSARPPAQPRTRAKGSARSLSSAFRLRAKAAAQASRPGFPLS